MANKQIELDFFRCKTNFYSPRKTNYKKSIVFLKKILKIFNIKNGITNKQILGIKSAGKIWQ